MPILPLPFLSAWAANLSGILPLSALFDLTSPPTTLHTYQLSSRRSLPTWVITPALARLLLTSDPTPCPLDRPGLVPPLYCIDGRWGDTYPCASPHTIRTITAAAAPTTTAPTPTGGRPQRLTIVRVSSRRTPHSRTSLLLPITAWLLWIASLTICLLASLHTAATYLLIQALTGLAVRVVHGHPRHLLDSTPSLYTRLVVAADSTNAAHWTAFVGGHKVVDSLLNKALCGAEPSVRGRVVLGGLVAAQWALLAGACAGQDWNGVVVVGWVAVCRALEWGRERTAAREWLCANGVGVESVQVAFSTRRSMLSALVALNPDSKFTSWIDPILRPSEDRAAWESALMEYLEHGMLCCERGGGLS